MTDPENGAVPPVPPPASPVTPPPVMPPAPTGGGYAAPPPAYSATGVIAPKKTLSLIGMIAGIVGVISFGWFLPASIAALVLGYMGKKREGLVAKGFWLTAIITGWVGIALTVLFVGGVILIGVLSGISGYNRY